MNKKELGKCGIFHEKELSCKKQKITNMKKFESTVIK